MSDAREYQVVSWERTYYLLTADQTEGEGWVNAIQADISEAQLSSMNREEVYT